MNIKGLRIAFAIGAVSVIGLSGLNAQPRLAPFKIESNAFPDGGVVPEKYAARGENVQPNFSFSGLPDNAVSVAIIFHDLDVSLGGGTDDVLHWTAWNIPASASGIPEGSLPAGSVSGNNIRNQPGYMGPGAPAGERYHHYVFEFYALSENLDLDVASTDRAALLAAMEGKIVAKAAYVGRYRGME